MSIYWYQHYVLTSICWPITKMDVICIELWSCVYASATKKQEVKLLYERDIRTYVLLWDANASVLATALNILISLNKISVTDDGNVSACTASEATILLVICSRRWHFHQCSVLFKSVCLSFSGIIQKVVHDFLCILGGLGLGIGAAS